MNQRCQIVRTTLNIDYEPFKLEEKTQKQDIINFDAFDEQMSKPLTRYNRKGNSDVSLDRKSRLEAITRHRSNVELNIRKIDSANKLVLKKESKLALEKTIQHMRTFTRIEKQFLNRDNEKENKMKLLEEDKLVLRFDIEINDSSSEDVLPNKDLKLRANDKYVALVPPYKLKRIIVPAPSANINKLEKKNLEKKEKEWVTRSMLKTMKNKEQKRKF